MRITFHEWQDSTADRQCVHALAADEAQVWLAPLPREASHWPSLLALLSEAERQQAAQRQVEIARQQFSYGRAWRRQLLGAATQREPTALTFGTQPRGKPFLIQPATARPLYFNLAHSGAWVALALTRTGEIGVDIEAIHELDDWPTLAPRIFSPCELAELKALPAAQQTRAFFVGWTQKEACLKALGTGLNDELTQIEITPTNEVAPHLRHGPTAFGPASQWLIRPLPTPPGLVGSVALIQLASSR